VDSTPIYNELQQKLMDPEDDSWGPSAPPEFVSALTQQQSTSQQGDSSSGDQAPSQEKARAASSRGGGRRHRAED